MDWLPKPLHRANPLPEVPCLSDDDYDHNPDWENYPRRQNYKPRTLPEWQAFFRDLPLGFDAFLERWLFWGVLEYILGGIPLSVKQYSRVVNNQRVIRISEAFSLVPDDRSLRPPQAAIILHELLVHQWDTEGLHEIELPRSQESRNRSLKVCSLYVYLRDAAWYLKDPRSAYLVQATHLIHMASSPLFGFKQAIDVLPIVEDRKHQIDHIVHTVPTADRIAVERLLALGWCPWEVHMLCEKFHALTIFYISQMQRPNTAQDHTIYHDTRSFQTSSPGPQDPLHASCSTELCRFKNVKQSSYSTAHAAACAGCETVAVNNTVLESILRSDEVPLVSIRNWDETGNEIELVPHQDEDQGYWRHIAFSHIWSDGLGNLRANALPSCQLKHLKHLIDKYNSSCQQADRVQHYWLDTLCVPPDGQGSPEIQMRATHKLREVYEGASVVIVLDRWLLDTPTKRMTAMEKLLRVACSPWTRRLWTLQEGGLARHRSLFFVFNHFDFFEADTAYQSLLACGGARKCYGMMGEMLARYQELRQARFSTQWEIRSQGPPFSAVRKGRVRIKNQFARQDGSAPPDSLNRYIQYQTLVQSLKFRATSEPSDEALCVAVLLKLDLKKVATAAPGERMLRIWDQTPEVPVTLLFWELPRLSNHAGYRWAPFTFLHPRATFDWGHASVGNRKMLARVTHQGLCLTALGVIFTPTTEEFVLDGNNHFQYCTHFEHNGHRLSIVTGDYEPGPPNGRPGTIWGGISPMDALSASFRRRNDASKRWGFRFAVLILEVEDLEWDDFPAPFPGLLVVIESQDVDGSYISHFVERVSIYRAHPEHVDAYNIRHSETRCQAACGDVISLTTVPTTEDQVWLID